MTTNHHTPISSSAEPVLYTTVNQIFSDLDAGITGLQTGVEAINQLRFNDYLPLTIVGGAITVTQTSHTVETEAAAASDDLVTINGGSERTFLLLQCVNASHAVVVKHNTGNIYLSGGVDVTLNDVRKALPLIYDGTKWIEVGAGYWTQVLNLGTLTSQQIVSDAITVTHTRHVLDTEGGASTDNLSTLNGGTAGQELVIQSTSAARVITVKHGTGNILLADGLDFALDNTNIQLTFVFGGTNWVQKSTPIGFTAKHELSTAYARVRSLRLPVSTLRAITGTGAYEALVMPSAEVRNTVRIKADGSNFYSGDAAFSIGGNVFTNDNANNGHYVKLETDGTSGGVAYLKTDNFNVVRRKWNPTFICVIKTESAVNNRRMWIGMFSAVPGAVDTLAGSGFGFRYSTVAGDTNWMAVCAASGTQTATSTGVTVATSTKYVLKIRVDSDNGYAYFSVNNSAEVQITTNLPAETTDLGLVAELIASNAVVRAFSISRIYLEHD